MKPTMIIQMIDMMPTSPPGRIEHGRRLRAQA
jgi:hypothetical protein